MSDYIGIAKKYVDNGFSVIPLKLDGSKSPTESWKPFQQRLANDQEMNTWFGNGQPRGLAIVTGSISDNLIVIDFDHDAEQQFARFWGDAEVRLPGITNKLLVMATPRPGRQVWFRQTSPPAGNQVLANSEPVPTGEHDADGQPISKPHVLIETRASGGYVAAPGSHPSVHRMGKPYQLIHGKLDALPQITDGEAETLLAICRSYNRFQPQHVQRNLSKPYDGEPRSGDIYNNHADIRRLLQQHSWQLHHNDREGVEYWTRPGKSTADGWSASLGHLQTTDGQPVLYVFSSAATPFAQNQGYDAFAVFAYLEHSQDFSAAAAAARETYEIEVQTAQDEYHHGKQEPYKPFPVELLPPIVSEYVLEHAAAINIDPAFVAVPMLPTLAGLIGQTRKLPIKRGWCEPSTIWACTVAEVSTGKTPGWLAATQPARQIETKLNDVRREQQRQYELDSQEYKTAKEARKTVSKPERPEFHTQLTIDDSTGEVLVDVHGKNWRGLLLTVDELAGWLRSFDQYRQGKGRDVENWLSIYNGGPVQVNRKTDNFRIYLPSTAVSVCGTIQPDVAACTLYSERFLANGFSARILSVRPPAETVRWSDAEVAEQTDTAMFQLADRLFSLEGEQYAPGRYRAVYLPFTDEAQQRYRQYMDDTADYADSLDGPLRAAWLKLRPAAARFALVFSVVRQLVEHPDGQAMQPVDIGSTQAGIDLAWWFGNEICRNYLTFHRQTPDSLDSHLAWIRGKYPEGITARQLQQGRRPIKTAEQAREVLAQLNEAGLGEVVNRIFIAH